jgi:hypothetical protein
VDPEGTDGWLIGNIPDWNKYVLKGRDPVGESISDAKKAIAIAGDTLNEAFVKGNNPYYTTAKAYKDFATTPGTSTGDVLEDAFVEGNNSYRMAFVAERQRLVDSVDIHMNAGDSGKVAALKTMGVFTADATGGTKLLEAWLKKDSNTRTLLTTGVPRTLSSEEVFERSVTGGIQVLGTAASGAQALNNFRFWMNTSSAPSIGPGAASPAEYNPVMADPGKLRLPPSRRAGADPTKLLEQVGKYGTSVEGMPPIQVTVGANGEMMINDGVTRATRAATAGKMVPVQVIDTRPGVNLDKLPTVNDSLRRLFP